MTERIPIGIAGLDLPRISREYTALVAGDSRFELAMLSNTWRAFQDALQENELSLLLVYADIAPSPDALAQGAFEKIHSVRRVFLLPAAPAEVLNSCFSAVQTRNAVNQTIYPLAMNTGGGPVMAAVGTRVIAFVSAQGGVGRSTPAEALGFKLAARRSIRTLLYSFDLPSNAPLRLGTRFTPSASEFLQRTEGGFQDAIQTTRNGLDVIIAPPESTHYAAAQKDGEQHKLHQLVTEAYKQHYAAILLDLPSDESAWMLQPLRAASTILLVARPTTEGVRATRHMLKLLTEVVGSQYRFGRDAFFLILNQRTPKSLYRRVENPAVWMNKRKSPCRYAGTFMKHDIRLQLQEFFFLTLQNWQIVFNDPPDNVIIRLEITMYQHMAHADHTAPRRSHRAPHEIPPTNAKPPRQ